MAASAAAFIAGVKGQTINWNDNTQVYGVVAYHYILDNLHLNANDSIQKDNATLGEKIKSLSSEATTEIRSFRRQREKITNELTALSSKVADFALRQADFDKDIDRMSEVADEKLKEIVSSLNRDMDDHLNSASSRIEAFQDSYSEQLKLEKAVDLWKDRYKEHSERAFGAKIAAICAGVLTIPATAATTWGTFKSVNVLLDGNNPVDTYPAGTLRPTFHFEFALTVAGTLAFLTLAIWLIRLIVRSYTTERHLAIDASSRAALTETYFSLIKDQGASVEDRAIVLGAIFRPVSDGVVKDDGLIALTPAAFLSSVVGMKSGGSSN